ncbi:MAG: ExeM/NucH family extracellular endonuclease [Flavobacteriales bacterium]|jgi:hypothetical protein|nr:ExeM/NucH family extracellular endonuclease [Flavobacteriales bacterium]
MRRHPFLPLLFPILGSAQTICAIQGSGTTSPYVDQQVTTEGVVTAVFTGSNSINGYFLEHPDCDGNTNTSNGLFVYAPNPGGVAVGQRLSVTGTVVEFNGLTELTSATFTVLGSGTVNPTPIQLPIGSLDHWERHEGMLVRFPGQLMVVDNSNWSQYGELYLAPERTMVPTDRFDPNDTDPDGTNGAGVSNVAAITAAQDVVDRSYVLLDDAHTNSWPNPTPWADAGGTMRNGSTVNGLTGVIHFSYGEYKVEPTGPVPFVHAPRPTVPQVGGSLRAAGYNAHNYFTTLGEWGAANSAELGRQRTKLVAAIQAMDADVLALCEIENVDEAVEDLVASLNGTMGAGTYVALEANAFGQGTRAIILYKPTVLEPITALYQLNTNIFQRPHLTQGFRVLGTEGRFLFSTMHLRSKLCDGASGGNEDQGDGQGCFNSQRRAQVDALVDHWSGLRSTSGITAQLIMGDFNAYTQEDPIDLLRASGLSYQAVEGGYSFGYASMFGSLDHAFATTSMDQAITGTAVWHINTDEPSTFDYQDANLSRYQPNAFRSGDHDPVLVGFNGGQLSTGLREPTTAAPVVFVQDGTYGQWRVAEGSRSTGLRLFDRRGALIKEVPLIDGVAGVEFEGLAPGCYIWNIPGLGAGRIVIP